MKQISQSQEHRKEPRLLVDIPISIHSPREPSQTPTQGILKNVSLHGVMASLDSPLPVHDTVRISIQSSDHPAWHLNTGEVQWCNKISNLHFTGIQTFEENNYEFPLKQVNDYIESILVHEKRHRILSKEYLFDLSFETYWGILFSSLKDILHTKFSSISCDLNMGAFHLEKIFDLLQSITYDEKIRNQSLEALNKIESGITIFNKFSALFRIMHTENRQTNYNDTPVLINIKKIINERIYSLEQKIQSFSIPYSGELHFNTSKNFHIVAYKNSFSMGIDFLLLYSYQSIIFYGAKYIIIKLNETENNISIEFINNGSQNIRNDYIIFNISNDISLFDFHQNDRKKILFILYILNFFTKSNATIHIKNESGNNSVMLKIPKVATHSDNKN